MKKTGQILKEKREAAGLSISEVALATKINPKILVAIEEGDEQHLPAKTFLKGFVRSYAGFLKTDVDQILGVFQEEMGEVGTPDPRREMQTEDKPSRRGVEEGGSKGLRAAAVIVIVLLIGLIIGVRQLIEKYQKEKVVVATSSMKLSPLAQPSPLAPATTVDKLSEVKLTVPPDAQKTEATNTQKPAKATSTAAEKKTDEKKPDANKTDREEASSSKTKDDSTKKDDKVKADANKDTSKDSSAPVKPAEKTKEKSAEKTAKAHSHNEIILEALDKVDVKLSMHGETKTVSLSPTQVHTIYADQPVTLDFSDGGAVNVILNGHIQGVPGDLGKPKQIKIP